MSCKDISGIFGAVLLKIWKKYGQNWKQTKCASSGACLNKPYSHTQEYHSAIKRNALRMDSKQGGLSKGTMQVKGTRELQFYDKDKAIVTERPVVAKAQGEGMIEFKGSQGDI